MNVKFIAIAAVAVLLVAGSAAYLVLSDDKESDGPAGTTGEYLKIFGNADGDHELDDDDKRIIQDYVDGKTSAEDLIRVTETDGGKSYYLADANLDGAVDSKDIVFLDGIIDRTGSAMNLIDTFGHLATVPLKIDRIACDYFATAELLQMVGVQDRIVAASNALMVLQDFYLQGADVGKVVNFNSRVSPDFEKVAEADPDIWVVSEDYVNQYKGNTDAVVIGLDTLVFDFDNIGYSSPIQSALLAGYIFGNVEKAEEYVDWYLEKWDMLYSKTSKIADDQRPTVFYTGYSGYIADENNKQLRIFLDNTVCWQAVRLAGGYNIIDDAPFTIKPGNRPTSGVNIDLEWISEQKYDYLFAHCTRYTGSGTITEYVPDHGYTCDDESFFIEGQKHLGEVGMLASSCDPGNMYLTPGDYMNGASGGILSAILVACVIQPDLFPDLDLQAEHQEYIDMMGFDYDLSKHGVFFVENE